MNCFREQKEQKVLIRPLQAWLTHKLLGLTQLDLAAEVKGMFIGSSEKKKKIFQIQKIKGWQHRELHRGKHFDVQDPLGLGNTGSGSVTAFPGYHITFWAILSPRFYMVICDSSARGVQCLHPSWKHTWSRWPLKSLYSKRPRQRVKEKTPLLYRREQRPKIRELALGHVVHSTAENWTPSPLEHPLPLKTLGQQPASGASSLSLLLAFIPCPLPSENHHFSSSE